MRPTTDRPEMSEDDLPEGFDIRFARPEDNEQLVAVSRASAIRVGDAKVVVDPGDDYFAAFRLMDEWTAVVITHDDKVVGVQCGCSFAGTLGPNAQPARVSQMIHTRFDPGYTRMGLWSHLNKRMLAAGRERAASFERGEGRAMASEDALRVDDGDDTPLPTKLVGVAYVHAENERMRQLYSRDSVWSDQPYRVTIACDAPAANGAAAAPATKDDAEAIAAILNETHFGEELYAPYTARSLTNRLERAPDLYSWGDVTMTEHAALGVWYSPEVRIRTEADRTTITRSRRALVLDHGFLPGAEDEYESLLRGAAARAGAAGYDHLSVFTTGPSPTSKILAGLAGTIEPYEVIVPFVEEPQGVAERGIYVDQAYF
ncbi:MAG TPA: hypothetical protein VM143_02250 [Acidimicrobiales bacterium]|nr:hypothetical protein [Acidimicrobiales bacterium]